MDTAERINPRNLAPTNGLVIVQARTDKDGRAEVRYVPPLNDRPKPMQQRPLPFGTWWSMNIIKDGRGHLFSRSKLVLTVANKDGGAHVDPELDEDYAALSRLNSLGVVAVEERNALGIAIGGPGRPASGNPALAAVRQIAFEVEATLSHQLRWLLPRNERVLFGGTRSHIPREAPCPCGAQKPAGECCLADAEQAFFLGDKLNGRGDVDLAIDAFQVSTELGHAKAPFNLGSALCQVGDYEAAETAFEIGVERGDGAAASNLGTLRRDRGDTDGARVAYEEGVRLKSPSAALNLGLLLVAEHDRNGAKAAWLQGAQLGDAEAAFQAANLYREDGDLVKALELYEQAREGGHPRATFNHALLLHEFGRTAEASAAMKEAAGSTDPEVVLTCRSK